MRTVVLAAALVAFAFFAMSDAAPAEAAPETSVDNALRCTKERTACALACANSPLNSITTRATCSTKCNSAKIRCDKSMATATRVKAIRRAHATKTREVASKKVAHSAK